MYSKKNQLFRILNSMKPTEKAYLKKFGFKQDAHSPAIHGLFDLIDRHLKKESEIDEEKLSHSFGKKFPDQNYTRIKSRLLEHVLDALREYDRKGNDVEKLFDLLAYAASMRKRGLFHDAWQILQKAEKLAEELEQIELMVLVKTEKYYYETFTQKYQLKYAGNDTIAELMEDLEVLRDRIEADMAAYRCLHFQKSIGVPRSPEDLQMLNEIRALPAFQAGYRPRLQSSRLNLAVAQSVIFNSIGDPTSVIRASEQLVSDYNPSEKLRRRLSFKFMTLYDTFMQAMLLSLQVGLFEEYHPRFLQIPVFGQDEKNLKACLNLYSMGIYAIVARKLDLIPGLVEEFNQVREQDYIPNYRKASLCFYMIFGPFLKGDLEVAYEQIQWLRNNQHLGLRHDIETGALVMECIILLEQNETEVLEHRLRAFAEFLRKRQRKFEMEAATLRWLRKSLAASDASEMAALNGGALEQMRSIVQANPNERIFLNAFDLLSWLESKLGEGTFADRYYANNIPSQA